MTRRAWWTLLLLIIAFGGLIMPVDAPSAQPMFATRPAASSRGGYSGGGGGGAVAMDISSSSSPAAAASSYSQLMMGGSIPAAGPGGVSGPGANPMNRLINAAFKKHGLALNGAAGTALRNRLESRQITDPKLINAALDMIVGVIKQKETLLQSIIDVNAVNRALSAMDADERPRAGSVGGAGAPVLESPIMVIDSYRLPKFRYNGSAKNFASVPLDNLSLHGTASDKAAMLRERYTLLHQRLMRNEAFMPDALPKGVAPKKHQITLTPIESLASAARKKGGGAGAGGGGGGGASRTITIFGMLTQMVDKQLFIEDCNASVAVDLTGVSDHSDGILTDHSFVVAQGQMRDDIFYASELVFPPSESRLATLRMFPQLERCGMGLAEVSETTRAQLSVAAVRQRSAAAAAASDSKYGGGAAAEAAVSTDSKDIAELKQFTALQTERMRKAAAAANDGKGDMMVVLSDVFLDKPKVMEKLSTLFEGFSGSSTAMFVFMGNFLSRKMGSSDGDVRLIRSYFDGLCDAITRHRPLAERCHFVFIPGPGDSHLCAGNTLPRMRLSETFVGKLQERLRFVHFVSNPARVLYYSQEIVLFRDDLQLRMLKTAISQWPGGSSGSAGPAAGDSKGAAAAAVAAAAAEESTPHAQRMLKTVLDQSHLAPVPVVTRPIVWNFDHALRLYPLPHTLIIADNSEFVEGGTYLGCYSFIPGTFSANFDFAVYYPAVRIAEKSKVP